MRMITMAVITLVTGAAAIGAWVMLGSGLPSFSNLGGGPVKKITRKRGKFRSAPYVILVPAKTLPEKVTSVQPKPPPVKIAPLAKLESPPEPEPVQKKPSPASAPAAPPAAKPPPVSKSTPIAKQTLEAILGPQAEPKPKAAPKLKTPAQTVPESKPKPEKKRPPAEQVKLKPVKPAIPGTKSEQKSQPAALVKPKPAALAAEPAASPPPSPAKEESKTTKQQRELTYAVETKRHAGEQKKKQTLAIGEKVRFRRVVPQGTGRLKTDDNVIVLAGVDSLRGNSKCKYPSGKSWDCGRWGKYALRRFIGGRAVVCDLIEEISETEVLGNCKVAGKDINKMQRAIFEASEDPGGSMDFFAQMGLSAEKLMEMNSTEQFFAIGEAIKGVRNQTKQAALAMDVFGRSGGELLTVFKG